MCRNFFLVFFGGDLSFWFLKFLESRTPRVYIFPSHVSCITHRRDFSTRRCTRTQMSWIFIFGGEMRKRIWRNERTSCGASSISVMSFSGRTRNRRNLINTNTHTNAFGWFHCLQCDTVRSSSLNKNHQKQKNVQFIFQRKPVMKVSFDVDVILKCF